MGGLHGGLLLKNAGFKRPFGKTKDFLPRQVSVPMRQGHYPESTPCVSKGDDLLIGQLIGREDLNGLPAYSPVSGQVLSIGLVQLHDGSGCTCINIENDMQNRRVFTIGYDRLDALPRSEILPIIQRSALCGLDGYDVPEHLKYQTHGIIENVLINAAGEPPGFSYESRLLFENAQLVIRGARALAKLTGGRATICMTSSSHESVQRVKDAMKLSDILLCILPHRYPITNRQLILAALHKHPSHKLPFNNHDVVFTSVSAAAALGESITTGLPVTQRIITVTGNVDKPANFLVPIGTSAGEVIDSCGGGSGDVIINGFMNGKLCSRSTPITLSTSGILVLNRKEYQEMSCIRCGECRRVCPEGLTPALIDLSVEQENIPAALTQGALICTGCGCCSYVCPSRRRLCERITSVRAVG